MRSTLLRRFAGDHRGSILMLVGLSALFLFGICGAGYDLGRQQLVRQKIQQAADASALAAASLPLGTSSLDRKNTANRYFQLNYPASYLGVPRMTPTVTVNTNDVEVKADALVTTNFVSNLGISSLTAKGLSDVQFKNEFNKIDLIMVLDNSGSMGQNVEAPSPNYLNGGTGVDAACNSGWYSFEYNKDYAYYTGLGYSPALSAYYSNYWASIDGPNNCATFKGKTGYTRLNALRFSASDLTDLLMNPNPNNNTIAVLTWDTYVMNGLWFTNSAAPVKSFLLNMYGRAQTDSSQGMYYAQLFGQYGFRPAAVHAVILMTDGANYVGGATPDPTVIANTIGFCNAMKASGVLIYTVGFGAELSNATPSSATSRQFLSDCATDNDPGGSTQPNLNKYYFVAADATQLHAAFNAIKGSLGSLRIIQ